MTGNRRNSPEMVDPDEYIQDLDTEQESRCFEEPESGISQRKRGAKRKLDVDAVIPDSVLEKEREEPDMVSSPYLIQSHDPNMSNIQQVYETDPKMPTLKGKLRENLRLKCVKKKYASPTRQPYSSVQKVPKTFVNAPTTNVSKMDRRQSDTESRSGGQNLSQVIEHAQISQHPMTSHHLSQSVTSPSSSQNPESINLAQFSPLKRETHDPPIRESQNMPILGHISPVRATRFVTAPDTSLFNASSSNTSSLDTSSTSGMIYMHDSQIAGGGSGGFASGGGMPVVVLAGHGLPVFPKQEGQLPE